MKKTLNVNIGSVAFVIDEDAYWMLKNYLDDVRSRFDVDERAEVMNDVEMRIADIFTETIASPRQVINVDHVRRAIAIIGKADDFGEKRGGYTRPQADLKKLRRSRHDRVLGGVCGGIAQYFGIDVVAVRIIMVVLLLVGSFGFWLYLILWLVVPSEPEISYSDKADGDAGDR